MYFFGFHSILNLVPKIQIAPAFLATSVHIELNWNLNGFLKPILNSAHPD